MKNKVFVSVVLFVCFIYLIFLIRCSSTKNPETMKCVDTIFVAEIWKKSFVERGRMVNDLIIKKKLINLTKDSVINILGKPTEEGDFFINYLVDMNCGRKKYGEMLFHLDFDSTKALVVEMFLTD